VRSQRDRFVTLSPSGDGGVRLTGRLQADAAAVVAAALDPLGQWRVHIGGEGHPDFTPPAWLDPAGNIRRNTYHRRR
jgi:hypothetical protein